MARRELRRRSRHRNRPAPQTDDAGSCVALQYAVAELLRSGVTSIVDLSAPYDGWLDTMAATGIRAWMVPSFASSHWSTTDGHSVDYNWDEARGHRLLGEAIELGRQAESNDSGRLSAMLGPAQIDTCTEDLLLTTLAAAQDHGWKLHTHAAQSLVEFYEMTRRHRTTPARWADQIGLLGPDCILAHAIFIDEHSPYPLAGRTRSGDAGRHRNRCCPLPWSVRPQRLGARRLAVWAVSMMPIRDPLCSLVYTAADRAVNDVFVGGEHVVADGNVGTIDVEEMGARLQQVRDQAERQSSTHHFGRRSTAEVAPLSLPFS